MFRNKKIPEAKEVSARIQKYCAFQERSVKEVRQKLAGWQVNESNTNKIVKELVDLGFIDEKRFAVAFAKGKFHSNKWGRIKIAYGLKDKGLSEAVIQSALEEIDENEYKETLIKLIKAKARSAGDINSFEARSKIAVFMAGKGFEANLIWDAIKELSD